MEREKAKRLLASPALSGDFAANDRRLTIASLRPTSGVASAGELPFLFFGSQLGSSQIPTAFDGFPDFVVVPSTKVPRLEPLQIDHSIPRAKADCEGPLGLPYLPGLRSWEPTMDQVILERSLSSPVCLSNVDLVSFIESTQRRFGASASACSSSSKPPSQPPSHSADHCRRLMRSSELARLRRSSISNRIRILRSLLPKEERMDMAKTLEEAHKYVRFLEAQVTALQRMPSLATFSAAPISSPPGAPWVGLERLNRQQMLQVVVNSARFQEKLCKMGLCVFSAEQVAALQRACEPCHPKLLLLPAVEAAASTTTTTAPHQKNEHVTSNHRGKINFAT